MKTIVNALMNSAPFVWVIIFFFYMWGYMGMAAFSFDVDALSRLNDTQVYNNVMATSWASARWVL